MEHCIIFSSNQKLEKDVLFENKPLLISKIC